MTGLVLAFLGTVRLTYRSAGKDSLVGVLEKAGVKQEFSFERKGAKP